ncbi:WD40-repeat-containing domain protein, partial [Piptocephalis cylindrospora]
MTVSPNGRDAVLGTQEGLLVVDLERPFEPPALLKYFTNWTPTELQWAPHHARQHLVAAATNQNMVIWNLMGQNPVDHVVKAHARAVTDLHWSPVQPNVLATASFDSYVHLWDLRNTRRPASSFCAWNAGAAQLQFNSKNEFVLASAHGSIVKIWDTRKGTLPTLELRTRGKRVYGIDWNPKEEHEILTSTQDAVIEFWDIRSGGRSRSRIHTDHPMRRVRFTPFGRGVLAMPQRGSNSLQLYA